MGAAWPETIPEVVLTACPMLGADVVELGLEEDAVPVPLDTLPGYLDLDAVPVPRDAVPVA